MTRAFGDHRLSISNHIDNRTLGGRAYHMKIVNLVVENFRAINKVALSELQEMIVIAGPNGCGKSCVLDSIRFFKSVYGGYQPNEWQQWLGEFQINFQRNPQQMASLLRDRTRSSMIEADIELAPDEIHFIRQHIGTMLETLVWSAVVPGLRNQRYSHSALALELRAHKPEVDRRVRELLPSVLHQLQIGVLHGRLEIQTDGNVTTLDNVLLELVFSSFHPKRIGVIDYHGSHRNYSREALGGINLNLDQEEERFRSTTLYNHANKYANIKSEMAAEYIRDALRAQTSNDSTERSRPLANTLKELFTIFFPDKRFLGPVPTADGGLDFPVEVQGGATHDINDLSSGEKEVLFGYLRLRNSAPRYSVILLDEPELHLNPALVRGLPQFYHKNLSIELDNQIWLVTHSDAFLREAMGNAGLRVFHMQYAVISRGTDNQIHEIQPGEEVEAAILEMVGDLAAYRPGAKVVFFEGENSEFDLSMVSRLFPTVESTMNLVSGGNRFRVESLHRTLERSVQAGNIPVKIYSVVDKDSGAEINASGEYSHHYSWDVYHIENYLLEGRFIDEALKHLNVYPDDILSPEDVERCLKKIAERQIGELISHKVRLDIGIELTEELNLRSNPRSDDIGAELHRAVVTSVDRVRHRLDTRLGIDDIRKRVIDESNILSGSLEEGDWKKHFRGRDILRSFSGKYVPGMRYEYFRDLIISQMVNAGYQPEGMKAILDSIIND